MAMTKKHFEWAAAYIARSALKPGERAAMLAFADDMFAEFSERFDSARFQRAAWGGEFTAAVSSSKVVA